MEIKFDSPLDFDFSLFYYDSLSFLFFFKGLIHTPWDSE